jgi:hypothetical protein
MSHYIGVKKDMNFYYSILYNENGNIKKAISNTISSPNKSNVYGGRRKFELLSLYKMIANKK